MPSKQRFIAIESQRYQTLIDYCRLTLPAMKSGQGGKEFPDLVAAIDRLTQNNVEAVTKPELAVRLCGNLPQNEAKAVINYLLMHEPKIRAELFQGAVAAWIKMQETKPDSAESSDSLPMKDDGSLDLEAIKEETARLEAENEARRAEEDKSSKTAKPKRTLKRTPKSAPKEQAS